MISLSAIISFLIPLCIVLLVLKLISIPIKLIISILVNILLGGLILFGLSVLGIVTVTLTWWMIALVGILGIPGACLLIILKIFCGI